METHILTVQYVLYVGYVCTDNIKAELRTGTEMMAD